VVALGLKGVPVSSDSFGSKVFPSEEGVNGRMRLHMLVEYAPEESDHVRA